ncbi:MAG TPA: GntR family transcriptional regulator [Terriglobales bacterium]|nr:GntR family transcriptional regulator [Terriglobales bacterium]
MKFVIQQDSSIPVHAQIKERIKTALLFGELRPGDTLPSIRDVEQELGVGRAIVRRAYLELQDCGILEIRHGRRVCISEDVQLRADASATRQLQQLVEKTLRDVRKLNVSHSSFAKLLLMRALELDRNRLSYLFVDTSKALAENIAQQISRLWEVPIHGASVSELPELFASENHHIHRIIVTYYRYDQVSDLVKRLQKGEHAEVVPVSVRFSEEMVKQVTGLPAASKVLLVAEDNEYRRHGRQPFADAYTEVFGKHDLEFAVRPASSFRDLKQIAVTNGYGLTIVSNSIWDRLPASVRKVRNVTHPRLEVDRMSLERARLSAGVIV